MDVFIAECCSPSAGSNPFSSRATGRKRPFDKRIRARTRISSWYAQPCGETAEFWQSLVRIKCTGKNASVGTIFHRYYLFRGSHTIVLRWNSPRGNYMRDSRQPAIVLGHRMHVPPRINAKFRSHPVIFASRDDAAAPGQRNAKPVQ